MLIHLISVFSPWGDQIILLHMSSKNGQGHPNTVTPNNYNVAYIRVNEARADNNSGLTPVLHYKVS